MNRNISVYLDLLRLLAALAVFLGHAQVFIIPSLPSMIAANAAEGVAVFFVLSGFVISFVAREKEKDWKAYATARCIRLYSVTILALATTFIADTIGRLFNNEYYNRLTFFKPESVVSLLKSVTFTNEIWSTHSVFGSNEPYWSLGFEVSYYIFFGLAAFLTPGLNILAAIAWLAICGFKITIYLTLWLLGVLAYNIVSSKCFSVSRPASGMLFIISVALYLAWKKLFFVSYGVITPMFEWKDWRSESSSFMYFSLVGVIVALNLLSFDSMVRYKAFWSSRIERCIRWCAGASFTLYLVHLPILIMISAVLPSIKLSPGLGALSLLWTLALVLLLAELGERRKTRLGLLVRSSWFVPSNETDSSPSRPVD